MYSSLESVSNTSLEQYYVNSLDQTILKKHKKKTKLASRYANLKKYHKEYNFYNEGKKCYKRKHEAVESNEVSESYLVYGPITKEEIQMKWRLRFKLYENYKIFKLFANYLI